MPNRIIREGILNSDRVNQLDPQEEVFYRRLLSKVDDHGLYDARASILRASLYPLRLNRVREADCTRWIAACEKTGLIVLYEAEGKPYLKVLDTRWQVRSDPKFPQPTTEQLLKSSDTKCYQLDTKTLSLSLSKSLYAQGGFDSFWNLYPKKKSKGDAKRAWLKLTPDETLQKTILSAVIKQSHSVDWMKDSGRYIPYPATWLNDLRWEDESLIAVGADDAPVE